MENNIVNHNQDESSENMHRKPWLFIALANTCLTVWLLVYWPTLQHMVSVWIASETFKHCFFILPITLYLIYEKKPIIKNLTLSPVWWLLPFLLLGQVVFFVANALDINLIMHLCAYGSLVCIVWMLVGHKAFRVILFPMAYLLFCVPFGEELVPWLQDVTADISVYLLNVFNIPVYREGLYLYLPNGTFHVAEACAGIRFLIGTFALGVLFAYLNYQRIWKRATFVVVSAIVPILANGVRAFGIVLIGYLSNMEHAVGADHLVYGWFFFLFVLIVLFFIGNIGSEKPPKVPPCPRSYYVTETSGILTILIVGVLVLPLVVSLITLPKTSVNLDKTINQKVMSVFPEAQQTPLSWAMKPEYDTQDWQGLIQGVPVYIQYRSEEDGQEVVSSLHRLFDTEYWSQRTLGYRDLDGVPVKYADIVNVGGEQRYLLSFYQIKCSQSADELTIKLQQFKRKLNGKHADGFYIVVDATELESPSSVLALLAPLSRELAQ